MDIPLLGCEGENAEFLAIDDLLDFSNDDIGGPIDSSCLTITSSESSTPSNEISKLASHASSQKDKNSALQPPCMFNSDELCIRCDDLAELEWLSNFVEESFSSCNHAPVSFCADSNGKSATDESKMHRDSNENSFQSTSPMSVLQRSAHSREKAMSFTCGPDTSVPARARTKRGRTAVCFWNTQILSAEASESILESSSTASTITSDSDMINNTFYDHDDDDDYDENEATDDDDDDDEDVDIDDDHFHHQHKRPMSDMSMKVKKFNKVMASFAKEKTKKSKVQDGGQQQGTVRKCLHCATQKTPQWRAGPMGPKTLCNACGVRYKSGRLCAEYRPAASPTFVENLHSNSHRKVLEMRRQRGDFNLTSSNFHDKPQCRLISRVK